MNKPLECLQALLDGLIDFVVTTRGGLEVTVTSRGRLIPDPPLGTVVACLGPPTRRLGGSRLSTVTRRCQPPTRLNPRLQQDRGIIRRPTGRLRLDPAKPTSVVDIGTQPRISAAHHLTPRPF